MAAKAMFMGTARDNAVEILPLITTQTFRIESNPLHPSAADITTAKLPMMYAFARMME